MWEIDPLAQWREGVGIGIDMDNGLWSLLSPSKLLPM
jgi:hypothetical protein